MSKKDGYVLSITKDDGGATKELGHMRLSVADIETLGERAREELDCSLAELFLGLLITTGVISKVTYDVSFQCRVDASDNDAASLIAEKISTYAQGLVDVSEMFVDTIDEY